MLAAVLPRIASVRKSRGLWFCAALLAAVVAPLACMPRGELVAADGSRRMVARDPQSGISVVLTTGAWDGSPDIDNEVTVIHALVANMGSTPVRLAPGDLDLVDERGFRHQLLDVGGSFIRSGDVDRGYHPGRDLSYGRLDWGGEIAQMALPWGVLAPGTQMRGYLYFRRFDSMAHAATLTWHLFSDLDRPIVDLAFDFFFARGAR